MIVLIYEEILFVLSTNKYQVINKIKLDDLKLILTIQTNSSIFALNFGENNVDLLCESYRRTELIMFLLENCDHFKRKRPLIQKTLKLRLTSKKTERDITFDYGNQMVKEVQASRDYLMAFKYGYLSKKSKTWYKSWEERFYVLSNIGLVYMQSPSDKNIKLLPFLDF